MKGANSSPWDPTEEAILTSGGEHSLFPKRHIFILALNDGKSKEVAMLSVIHYRWNPLEPHYSLTTPQNINNNK